MTRTVIRRSSGNSVLWLAAGAAAGIALGVLLADRAGGSRHIMRRFRRVLTSASRFMRRMDDVYHDAYPDEPGEEASDDPADAPGRSESTQEYIDERVLQAFQNDPVLSERAIEIDEPEPGMIWLTGRVPTARDAAHAVTIARGTPGVTSVENHLRVRDRSRR